MANTRNIALNVLLKIENEGAYSNIALNNAIKENRLSGVDSSFVSALVYGVLERRITLDYIIRSYSKIPLRKIETKTKILDTRKTTPNLRILERQAVRDGGGFNHRYSLSDMVLIKDNHIDAVGSITKAVSLAKAKTNLTVEVEVETLEQFKEALATGADIIMLDNMSNELMALCVKLNNKQKRLEASGNMSLERVKSVAALGVDFISVGSLTYASKALDISLKFH